MAPSERLLLNRTILIAVLKLQYLYCKSYTIPTQKLSDQTTDAGSLNRLEGMRKEKLNTHPIDILVGENLRRLRKLAAISQQELGDRIGVTFQQIQKNESGINRVAASRLWEFAEIFDVGIMEFFVGENDGYDIPSIQTSGQKLITRMSDRELKMVRLIRNCEPNVQKAVVAMLKTVSSPKTA